MLNDPDDERLLNWWESWTMAAKVNSKLLGSSLGVVIARNAERKAAKRPAWKVVRQPTGLVEERTHK
jgi:hypothetical protein